MNYLAHLHLAATTQTSFSGNFLGDFIKGNPEHLYPKEIVKGIRLHRHVDSYTDQHPQVLAAKQLFPEPLRRYAPIALDMFWDHCLALHWPAYHHLTLAQFCQLAEQNIAEETLPESIILPDRFQRINGWVWQDKWLESYAKMANINYALTRMATRSERMAPLAQTGEVLNAHYAELSAVFIDFYVQVQQISVKFVEQYNRQ